MNSCLPKIRKCLALGGCLFKTCPFCLVSGNSSLEGPLPGVPCLRWGPCEKPPYHAWTAADWLDLTDYDCLLPCCASLQSRSSAVLYPNEAPISACATIGIRLRRNWTVNVETTDCPINRNILTDTISDMTSCVIWGMMCIHFTVKRSKYLTRIIWLIRWSALQKVCCHAGPSTHEMQSAETWPSACLPQDRVGPSPIGA